MVHIGLKYIFIANVLVTAAFGTQRMNKKQCLVKDKIITALTERSLENCLHECVMRIACLSLNYRRRFLLCELFSVSHGTFVTNNGTTGPCVHILRSDITYPEYSTDCACNNLQTCLPESDTCVTKECTNLEIANVVVKGNMKNIGARVLVKCVSVLYEEQTGRTSIQCQPNGTWDYEPNCVSRYMGCYKDNRKRILMSENVVTDREMTIEKCITHCHQYNYAALQNGWECFCGNTLDERLKISEQYCQRTCFGNATQTCGGWWHGSVYKLK